MTRGELRDKITKAVKQAFSGDVRRLDGSYRPHLDDENCEHVAIVALSTVAQSGLAICEIVVDEPANAGP